MFKKGNRRVAKDLAVIESSNHLPVIEVIHAGIINNSNISCFSELQVYLLRVVVTIFIRKFEVKKSKTKMRNFRSHASHLLFFKGQD